MMASLTAGLVTQAAPSDTCALLVAEEIRTIQGSTLRDRKASAETVGALHYRQCFFAASEFERSVSLTVISDAAGRSTDRAERAFWERTFKPVPKAAPPSGRVPRKKDPPRPVPGAGEEAFWTGDPRTGSLYVLDGGVVLRISVGGVPDEADRLQRSIILAKAALERLKSQPA
jgi:hypothetical protein